jgi:hypothetical protein
MRTSPMRANDTRAVAVFARRPLRWLGSVDGAGVRSNVNVRVEPSRYVTVTSACTQPAKMPHVGCSGRINGTPVRTASAESEPSSARKLSTIARM